MSRRSLAVVSCLVSGLLVIGCDRAESVDPVPATAPSPIVLKRTATAPATTATGPATTQAAEAMISIDGTLVLFPPARIRLDDADGKVIARLFSDDPKHALEESYDGNSFYLQLEFDPGAASTDPRDLAGLVVTHRGSSTERDDSPYGIFLEGRRWVLQPADVRVAFDGYHGGAVGVQLEGQFLLFDSHDIKARPKRAAVTATFPADVQTRK